MSFITVAQAAQQIEVDEKVIYRLIDKGNCPFALRLSMRTIRISQERFDEWIKAGGVEALERPKGFATAEEVAEHFCLPASAVMRLAAAGTLPSHRWGKTVLFDPVGLKAWEERQFEPKAVAEEPVSPSLPSPIEDEPLQLDFATGRPGNGGGLSGGGF